MEKLNELVALAKEYEGSTKIEDALVIHKHFSIKATMETILAIAEAFRALEQENSKLRQERAGLAKEANDFEAKLAGFEKYPPAGTVWVNCTTSGTEYEFRPSGNVNNGQELFTRPAPSINLAELVPDESDLADRHIAWLNTLQRPMFSGEDWEELILYTWLAFRDSYRVHKDAILRNIEEAK